MNIFDLIYASKIKIEVQFDGDGVDDFDHSVHLNYKLAEDEFSCAMYNCDVRELISGLETLTRKLKDNWED